MSWRPACYWTLAKSLKTFALKHQKKGFFLTKRRSQCGRWVAVNKVQKFWDDGFPNSKNKISTNGDGENSFAGRKTFLRRLAVEKIFSLLTLDVYD